MSLRGVAWSQSPAHHPLQVVPDLRCAAAVPRCAAGGQETLDGGAVEVSQQGLVGGGPDATS